MHGLPNAREGRVHDALHHREPPAQANVLCFPHIGHVFLHDAVHQVARKDARSRQRKLLHRGEARNVVAEQVKRAFLRRQLLEHMPQLFRGVREGAALRLHFTRERDGRRP